MHRFPSELPPTIMAEEVVEAEAFYRLKGQWEELAAMPEKERREREAQIATYERLVEGDEFDDAGNLV